MKEDDSTKPTFGLHALRFAAILVAVSALCICAVSFFTASLFVYYQPQMTAFNEALSLPSNPLFMARAWVQPIGVLTFMFGGAVAALLCWRRAPALATGALLNLFVWGVVALMNCAIELFMVPAWRSKFSSSSIELQQQLRTLIGGASAVQGGIWFISSSALALYSACMCVIFMRYNSLWCRWMGLLAAAVALTLVFVMITRYRGDWLAFNISALWVLPAVQVLARSMLVAWLWGQDADSRPVMGRSLLHPAT